MAITESCSDSPPTSISFDFGSPDTINASVENQKNQSDSSSNVTSDFCFYRNNDSQESLSTAADELFSDGKILPARINKIDNVSSKQILYVHTNNSIRHCSEVNKIGNMNQELSVKLEKKISGAKLTESKPFPPLHELLYGTSKTCVSSNGGRNCKTSFRVRTDNGEEDRRKELKSTSCSINCCGFKFTSGNGVFGRGFFPFPLDFQSSSVWSVQKNSSKVVSSLPRNSRMHLQNTKDFTSPVRRKSPSSKQLIVTDHKLHNSLPVRNRKPSLKQLIVSDYMMKL